MAAVYSTNLFSGHDVTSWTSSPVPAGDVVIVRDIDVWFGGGVIGGPWSVFGIVGQTFAWGHFDGLLAALQSWRGRQVIPPGQTFGFTALPGLDVTISGYVLTA